MFRTGTRLGGMVFATAILLGAVPEGSVLEASPGADPRSVALEARQLEPEKAYIGVEVGLEGVQAVVVRGLETGNVLVRVRARSVSAGSNGQPPLADVAVDADLLHGEFGQILEYDVRQERGLSLTLRYADGTSREYAFHARGDDDFRVVVTPSEGD